MTIDKPPNIVIVDTDAGVDDGWSLLLLLAAKRKLNFEIAGITCVNGNTTVENVCINVLRILDAARCFNIPVYKGASTPLILPDEYSFPHIHFHGIDGFGDADFDKKVDISLIKKENAVVALNRIVTEHKGKVSLLCLGPLTNIALAIRTFSSFQHDVRDIYIMGGNYQGVGNTTSAAEFNFWADPEAAQIVLDSEIKLKVMLPWEPCLTVSFSLDWRDNVLGRSSNTVIQLMNKAEHNLRKKHSFKLWTPADQIVTAYLIDRRVANKVIPLYITVELHGLRTRGQVVVGHKSVKEPNVHMIVGIDQKQLGNLLLNIHCLP